MADKNIYWSIKTLKGGMNNSDPPMALPEDQCVLAQNVEFVKSTLGERRRGAVTIDLTGAGFLGFANNVNWIFRHLPTNDEGDAELWALGTADSWILRRKTTIWNAVSISGDEPDVEGAYPYRWEAVSLHGKLFVAYKNVADTPRLHVWDGTTFRRVGLAAPAAPSVTNTAAGGSYVGDRYFRIRYVTVSGSTVLRRSEPSESTAFTPSGSNTGAVITKPAAISEGETHWEVEASIDDVLFYRIARVAIVTTTYDDTTAFAPGYASATDSVLSEDIGDYSLIGSAKFVIADEDRLVFAGDWEDATKGSRIGWTPVFNADGVGNDERIELDTDPVLDLDGMEGGDITGMSRSVNGSFFIFKQSHIYKAVRSGRRTRAYDIFPITKQRGALPGSIVDGLDQMGRPCIYFIDRNVGPCRLGAGGLLPCGEDIRETWKTVNINATLSSCTSLYYPASRQVHWALAIGAAEFPNSHVVLQTNNTRETQDGVRGGWSVWTGPIAGVLSACLFADNVDDGVARNHILKPFYAVHSTESFIWKGDIGSQDQGVDFHAEILTKPYVLKSLLHQFRVLSGCLLGKNVDGAAMKLTIIKDYGLEEITLTDLSFDSFEETHIIRMLDNLSIGELRTVQFEFADVDDPVGRWELIELALRLSEGQGF